MSKIKYEHSMIGGLRAHLERQFEPIAEFRSIIPRRIGLQYTTDTGPKAHRP